MSICIAPVSAMFKGAEQTYKYSKYCTSNIVHICFGEDVSDMTIEIDVPDDRLSWNWTRKTMILSEAIHNFTQ